MNPIPYGRQNITDEDIAAVTEALRSDYLTQGPRIVEFERKFSEYCDAKYAVAVSNGTAALHLAMLALGIKQDDAIITTPITFAASANSARYCGADVAFCDIDKDTYLMDLNKLEVMLDAAPLGKYKAVVPVDFAGYPIDAERLRTIADRYDLAIVEDACHAPGAYFTDSKGDRQLCGSGKYADMTIFSFHPVKHIATGEGGMITTNDKYLFDKLTLYRTHGITKNPDLLHENHGGWYYEMQDLGFNYRITDFQAALGISQLSRADSGLVRRQAIAERYNTAFADNPKIVTPKVADNVKHAYHLYVIQVDNRKGLYDYLHSQNIYAQVHYVPVHVMPYYKKLGNREGDMPVAELYYSRCLSLPMFPTLTDEDQQRVIDAVKYFCK